MPANSADSASQRNHPTAGFRFIRLRGALAWWLWGGAHIAFLVGGRNRMTVMLNWLWAYLTFRRGTGLITETGSVALLEDVAAEAPSRARTPGG